MQGFTSKRSPHPLQRDGSWNRESQVFLETSSLRSLTISWVIKAAIDKIVFEPKKLLVEKI